MGGGAIKCKLRWALSTGRREELNTQQRAGKSFLGVELWLCTYDGH
jgi:hypothetical protein